MADAHDEAWRCAYRGVIPGIELDKLIMRRGPEWWDSAIRKGSRISILAFGDNVAGYANYGRNRARSLFYDGEIYELYLRPEYPGPGLRPAAVHLGAARSRPERIEEPGDLGAGRQRACGGVLQGARRQGGGALVRSASAAAAWRRSRLPGTTEFGNSRWIKARHMPGFLFVERLSAHRTRYWINDSPYGPLNPALHAEHDGLVLAALEAAGVVVGDLDRKLIGVRIGAAVDIADMADAAGPSRVTTST